jgi:hypothetical protein
MPFIGPDEFDAAAARKWYSDEYGINKIEPYNKDIAQAGGYLCKYLVKQVGTMAKVSEQLEFSSGCGFDSTYGGNCLSAIRVRALKESLYCGRMIERKFGDVDEYRYFVLGDTGKRTRSRVDRLQSAGY